MARQVPPRGRSRRALYTTPVRSVPSPRCRGKCSLRHHSIMARHVPPRRRSRRALYTTPVRSVLGALCCTHNRHEAGASVASAIVVLWHVRFLHGDDHDVLCTLRQLQYAGYSIPKSPLQFCFYRTRNFDRYPQDEVPHNGHPKLKFSDGRDNGGNGRTTVFTTPSREPKATPSSGVVANQSTTILRQNVIDTALVDCIDNGVKNARGTSGEAILHPIGVTIEARSDAYPTF